MRKINCEYQIFYSRQNTWRHIVQKISFKERNTKHDFLFVFVWLVLKMYSYTYIHMYICISFVLIVNPNNLREPARAPINKSTWCAWHIVPDTFIQTYVYTFAYRTYKYTYVCIYACKYNTLPGQLLYKHN